MGRGLKTRALVALLAVFAMTLAPATGLEAGKSPFKPGLYVGKTSQGYPVKLRLTVRGPGCSGNPCLFAPNDESEIYISLECPAIGQPTNEYMDLAANKVNANGT